MWHLTHSLSGYKEVTVTWLSRRRWIYCQTRELKLRKARHSADTRGHTSNSTLSPQPDPTSILHRAAVSIAPRLHLQHDFFIAWL